MRRLGYIFLVQSNSYSLCFTILNKFDDETGLPDVDAANMKIPRNELSFLFSDII